MEQQHTTAWPSVSERVEALVEALVVDAPSLRLGVSEGPLRSRIVDAGIRHPGGLEGGRRIAEICLGALGTVTLRGNEPFASWPVGVDVHTANPVLACLGSQYAGWNLAHGEGKDAFWALGSGPARALAGKEDLFDELGYHDRAETACLVMEVDRVPPEPIVEKISRDCGVDPHRVTLVLTPTQSLAGAMQVVARVLEVALHKVHTLGFPLNQVADGLGSAPLPPPASEFVTAMGRTNDAILFGGRVHLFVTAGDDDARDLAERLPSSASKDYGTPFGTLLKQYDYDFYQMDPLLFSPARVVVTALGSGNSFAAGAVDEPLLDASFSKPA